VTDAVAGLEKLANPGFFDANNPTSIQAQMAEAARSSPIHVVIAHLVQHAVPVGVVIALAELAVGLGTLLGLWTRIAAAGGTALSLSLFLTVSYHSSPYYTGSDIVFVFAWLPLIVAGAGGVLAVDAVLHDRAPTVEAAPAGARGGEETDRRTFAIKAVAVGAVAAVGVGLAGLAAGVGRWAGHYKDFADSSTTKSLSPGVTSRTTVASSPTTASTHPPGKVVGSAGAVPVQGAATFTDPATGDPAVVVQPVAGTFVAFDAICPHEGCTVNYSAPNGLFICPCHGSRFNGRTGALVKGPATRGLTPIAIAEGPDGQLYAR
jgi:thiosulfate dehydrogenase [quinone] large subunit